ncbi:MAG: amidohydrolase family protein [Dehalococcoidales bacterium]|nr:amidohydrolase family protein [Dehalococcoidales bacterium]
MSMINSVLGPLDTKKLGFTLMHEHLIVGFHGILSEYPEFMVNDAFERIVRRLKEAKEGGVDTIVDMTTNDLGRDVNLMAEASRRSGVNIIACAGWWRDVPRFVADLTPDQMARAFVREIEEGIAGTNIKAGILKSASDFEGVTPPHENGLRAVARAHKITGVPIAIHSYHPGQIARQQLRILRQEEVDMRRIKVDHSNDTTDIEFLLGILERGCFLGLDRYPGRMASPMARTKTLKALIDAGYADRLCPSHDTSLAYVLRDGETPEKVEESNPHRLLYMKKTVFPWLREMGVKDSVISRLCIDGPRNFFEGK